MKHLVALTALLFSIISHASELSLKDFEFHNTTSLKIETQLVKRTLDWKRQGGMLVPHVLARLRVPSDAHGVFVVFDKKRVTPVLTTRGQLFELEVSLFEEPTIEIHHHEKNLGSVVIKPKPGTGKAFVDHSCSPFELEVTTEAPEHMSVGCELKRLGLPGDETPLVDVKLLRATGSEAHVHFTHTSTSEVDGIQIKARLPKRLNRLKLAMGLGPYLLEGKSEDQKSPQIAPTLMLYGKLDFTDEQSLRFFDSYSKDVSMFHNGGIYYAWDLARFCDKRCQLTSLLGLQGIDFRYNSNSRSYSDVIFPQGFEFIYHHAFNQRNYKLSYGMFASLSQTYDYQNIWIRYGKASFWELNYIEWAIGRDRVRMYGLSYGFPLISFF